MLRDVPFWVNHPQKERFVFEIMIRLVPIYIGQGETIFEEGRSIESMYFIREGHVRLTPTDMIVGRGSFFGDMAFAGNGIAAYTAVTESECALFTLSRTSFEIVSKMFERN